VNDYLLSLVLAIIEGLTEFIPVSSTAHLRIAEALVGISLTSAVDDQMLGGGLMWSGAHMYLLPILIILYGLSRDAVRERDGAPA
jgi:undecaprenyl pyrophosphate phosphatase UppP